MVSKAVHPLRRLLTAAIALAASGCGTTRGASNYDTAADFPSYTTFALMQRSRGDDAERTTVNYIQQAIETRLRDKGFTLVNNPDSANALVDFTLGAKDRVLSVDILDNRTRRPVWHGWSKAALPQLDSPGTNMAIQQAVRDVLSEYPPGHTR